MENNQSGSNEPIEPEVFDRDAYILKHTKDSANVTHPNYPPNRVKGLRPFAKGYNPNPLNIGKSNRIPASIKKQLVRRLKKSNAMRIAAKIIELSEAGNLKHTELLLQLMGELDPKPEITVNNNNINMDEETSKLAKEYFNNNNKLNVPDQSNNTNTKDSGSY